MSGTCGRSGHYRILHVTWFAFFLSFVVWFKFAPFSSTIGADLGLDRTQLQTLALCNVALTVPARILIGMALDRWGPRRVYAWLLCAASVPCLVFALATTFEVLVASRLALSVVGAGFVVGIRWSRSGSLRGRSAWPRGSTAAGATSARRRQRCRCPASPPSSAG